MEARSKPLDVAVVPRYHQPAELNLVFTGNYKQLSETSTPS